MNAQRTMLDAADLPLFSKAGKLTPAGALRWISSPSAYEDAGRQAAKARRQKDEARARFFEDAAYKMRNAEGDAQARRLAFELGVKAYGEEMGR